MVFNKELVDVALEELLGEEVRPHSIFGEPVLFFWDIPITTTVVGVDKIICSCKQDVTYVSSVTKYKDSSKGVRVKMKNGDIYRIDPNTSVEKGFVTGTQKTYSLLDLVSKSIVSTEQVGNKLVINVDDEKYTITGYGFYPDTKLSKKSFEGQVIESVHCKLNNNSI